MDQQAEPGLGIAGIEGLGSSEELFRAVSAHTPVGVFVSNAAGSCVYVNERWCELAGLSAEEALGGGWAAALHPHDRDRVLGEWGEAAGDGRDSIVEYRFKRADGSVSWIQGFASALHDREGNVAGWVGTCLDLTARREAEQEVVRESERFRAAFDNAPIGVALVSSNGRWLQANDALCAMLGYSREQLLQLRFEDVTHPDDLEATLDHHRRQIEGEPVETRLEKRYLRADGAVVWAAVNSTFLRDADGEPLYSVAQIEDITERVHSQYVLEEAEERFRRAFDDAPIGMALVGLTGEFLRVNRRLGEITGYGEDELLQLTFQDITVLEDLDADLELVQDVLSGEINSYQLEKRYRRRDGSPVWVLLSVSLVRDNEQVPLYFVSQIEDITERKRAEQDLQHLADHDPLTGLVNRRRFYEELQRELARSRRYGGQAAVLVVDIDRFKHINDSLGHAAGDDVLCAVGQILVRRLRTTDIVSRIGGDEFAVIALDSESEELARTLANDVGDTIRSQTILARGTPVTVTVSIGVTLLGPDTLANPDELFIAADDAMYTAKQDGRDRTVLAA